MFKAIVCSADTCFNGTRLNVFDVVSSIHDDGFEFFLATWDYVTLDAAQQAIEYCKIRQCESEKPTHYCDGCSLRSHDDDDFEDYLREWADVSILNDQTGALDTAAYRSSMYADWLGRPGWELANEIARRSCSPKSRIITRIRFCGDGDEGSSGGE